MDPLERLRALRVLVSVEADGPLSEYTGRLTKTIVYAMARELRLLHGVRGIVHPLHISPLFKPGPRENDLGTVASPMYTYDREGERWILESIELGGEYVFHVGGEAQVVGAVARGLEELRTPLMFRFADRNVKVKLENIWDITGSVREKFGDGFSRVTIYFKAPTLISNVFAPTRLPKFSPSAVEVLMAPYLLVRGGLSLTKDSLLSASLSLGWLVETWYTLRTLRPVMIPFKGKREAALMGKATYIYDPPRRGRRGVDEMVKNVLLTAEIAGVGESRANGFGTVVVGLH
ncbi:MAG: CRISPR system precrRNA processing endoribonuclease RAMP protein Cas6 [Desulfurococcales archaeon]|nr:CRISPR system precrRNA processing endoribonuclease RAMP protein Cas6 [Desulfurococcales archaeon]